MRAMKRSLPPASDVCSAISFGMPIELAKVGIPVGSRNNTTAVVWVFNHSVLWKKQLSSMCIESYCSVIFYFISYTGEIVTKMSKGTMILKFCNYIFEQQQYCMFYPKTGWDGLCNWLKNVSHNGISDISSIKLMVKRSNSGFLWTEFIHKVLFVLASPSR